MNRFLLLIACILFACVQNVKEDTTEKKPKDSLAVLNEQIASNPANSSLLFRRAEYFFNSNNGKMAYDDITKAIAIDSSKEDYYMLLANIHFKGLQIEKSIHAFEKAIELNPANPEPHVKLAELYLYLKAYPKSLKEADDALRMDKNIAKAYFIKGFAFKEEGDTGKAISSFQTAAEVKPDYYDAYIQLGNIFAVRKDKLSLQYYNNAIKIRPQSTEALYNRGLLLQNVGQIELAENDYNTIIKIDPTYADAYYNLGFIELSMKEDYKAAIKQFTNAINANNNYAEAFYNRGLSYELLGDKEAARKDYQSALTIIPTYKLAKDKLKQLK
jgi:tetratricopeptide (TPR) repeat protein